MSLSLEPLQVSKVPGTFVAQSKNFNNFELFVSKYPAHLLLSLKILIILNYL